MNIFKLAAATAVSFAVTTAAVADTGLMTKFDDIKWTNIEGTPLSLSILWGDRDTGPYAMYLRLPGGYKGVEHSHTFEYEGITIQGEWQHTFAGETKVLPVGSRVTQPGNAFHSDACVSDDDCILFVFQDGKGDAIFRDHH